MKNNMKLILVAGLLLNASLVAVTNVSDDVRKASDEVKKTSDELKNSVTGEVHSVRDVVPPADHGITVDAHAVAAAPVDATAKVQDRVQDKVQETVQTIHTQHDTTHGK